MLNSFSQRNGQNVQGSSKGMFVPSLNQICQNCDLPQVTVILMYYLIRPIKHKNNILKNH